MKDTTPSTDESVEPAATKRYFAPSRYLAKKMAPTLLREHVIERVSDGRANRRHQTFASLRSRSRSSSITKPAENLPPQIFILAHPLLIVKAIDTLP